MRLLLLNTCGAEGVVALADAEAGVLAEERLPARGSSEFVLPAVRRVLGGLRVADLVAVGVVTGPGSFTGVRVGLSVAKGLCEAADVRMVGMSRLALLGTGVALLDAGRGEFYYGDGVEARVIGRGEAESRVLAGQASTCEERVREALGEGIRLVAEPAGAEMLAAVLERMGTGEWTDVATVDALYLRRTDAELAADRR